MLKKIFVASLAVGTSFGMAFAGDFPSKPVTIIVPYGAGGGTDSFARALEGPLEDALGADVVVQNVSGGGGAVGFMQTLSKEADGYTVTVPLNAIYTLVGMGNVPFQVDEFDYIAKLAEDPYVLTVHRSDKWTDLESFVAASKEKTVTLGVAGVGSSGHIMTIAMTQALGLNANLIPYDGNAAAAAAALGGHIDGVVLQPSDAASAIQGEDGLLPLASTGKSALLEGVSLFTDHNVELTATQWRGIAAPAGIDPEVVAVWESALQTAVQDEAFKTAIANLGSELKPIYGDELQDFVKMGKELFIPLTQTVASK